MEYNTVAFGSNRLGPLEEDIDNSHSHAETDLLPFDFGNFDRNVEKEPPYAVTPDFAMPIQTTYTLLRQDHEFTNPDSGFDEPRDDGNKSWLQLVEQDHGLLPVCYDTQDFPTWPDNFQPELPIEGPTPVVASSAPATPIGSSVPFMDRQKPKKRYRAEGTYVCTFCRTETFTTKGNWTRHETCVHLVPEYWVCAPDGPINPKNNLCVYCGGLSLPTSESCATTCAHSCTEKDIDARKFVRKYNFREHLKRVHNTGLWHDSFETWLRKDDRLPGHSRCGFCTATFGSWQDRNNHIARHFEAGFLMEHWKGDWGLSPRWMQRLNRSGSREDISNLPQMETLPMEQVDSATVRRWIEGPSWGNNIRR